jgi:uncharacterized membrane protein YdcZ (DUF606 family)
MVHILLSRLPYVNVLLGSYILQVSSFVAALISLMTGTSVLIVYDTCYANNRILKVCHFPSCALHIWITGSLVVNAISLTSHMLPDTNGVSIPGSGSLDVGFDDR